MEFIENLFVVAIILVCFFTFFHYAGKYINNKLEKESKEEKKAEKEAKILIEKNKDLIIDCIVRCIKKGSEGQIIFLELSDNFCKSLIIIREVKLKP